MSATKNRTSLPRLSTRSTRRARTFARVSRVVASSDREEALREADSMAVAGLPSGAVCDAFECTVSPACELTTKQIARSIVKKDTEASLVSKDVRYKNPYVSFSGWDNYASFNFWKEEMADGLVRIKRMSMAKEDAVCIEWKIEDVMPAGKVIVDVESTFKLNLISGRVLEREDKFNLDDCPLQTIPVFVSKMSAYSLKSKAKGVADAAKRISGSFSSFDDSDEEFFSDPRDPNKFFQQQDTTMSDAFQLATFIAAIYAIVKVLEQIEGLK